MAEPGFNLSSRVPIDGTLIALLVPSLAMTVFVIPVGYAFSYGNVGGLVSAVPAGATANFYWMMLDYVPIIATLAFATSMVWTGRVVAKVWRIGAEAEESTQLLRKGRSSSARSMAQDKVLPAQPEQQESLMPQSPASLEAATPVRKASLGGLFRTAVSAQRAEAEHSREEKTRLAIHLVKRMSAMEYAQWALLVAFVAAALVTGNIAQPERPLWGADMAAYVVFFVVFGCVLVVFAAFTLRNLRGTLVRREGRHTVEYVAAFLGRVSACLLGQHVCFFYVAVSATNMQPSMQPVAFATVVSAATASTPPCSLLSDAYLATNCTRSIDLYRTGTLGAQYDCMDDPWYGYSSPFHACGGAIADVQLRNMGYSALMINFNLFLYLLLRECTRDMSTLALSKITRGMSDTRTSSVLALTGLALGCCPLFFAFMVLSPMMLFKADLVAVLTVAFGVNIACWVLIGLLLNLEFFVAIVRLKLEHDIFISYRVQTERELALDLYKRLKRESLRVFLDQECLKDGEDWEDGFVKGLVKSSVYVLLFSRAGMEALTQPSHLAERCDNVLLELRLARELQERRGRNAFKIYPLLLGQYTHDSGFTSPFDWWPSVAEYPEESCPAVEAKLAERLARLELGTVKTSGNVAENMRWLFKIQGLVMPVYLYDNGLEHASRKLTSLADQARKDQLDAGHVSCGELLSHLSEHLRDLCPHLCPRKQRTAVNPETVEEEADKDYVTDVAAEMAVQGAQETDKEKPSE